MKQCTTELAAYLNTHQEYKACNLFAINLADGNVIYTTDFDKDVVFENHVFRHDLFIMKREQAKTSGTPEVDTTTLTLYADRQHNDLVNNTYVLEAIHKGAFEGAYLAVWRAFFDSEVNTTQDTQIRPYGALKCFTGRIELSSCNTICAKFSVKAETTGLNASLPVRVFQAQSSFANVDGDVVEYSGDAITCVIPLKPSQNVLYKL